MNKSLNDSDFISCVEIYTITGDKLSISLELNLCPLCIAPVPY